MYKKPDFSSVSLLDLVNAKNNCEFIMSRLNLTTDVYEIIDKFHSDLIYEIDRRAYGG